MSVTPALPQSPLRPSPIASVLARSNNSSSVVPVVDGRSDEDTEENEREKQTSNTSTATATRGGAAAIAFFPSAVAAPATPLSTRHCCHRQTKTFLPSFPRLPRSSPSFLSPSLSPMSTEPPLHVHYAPPSTAPLSRPKQQQPHAPSTSVSQPRSKLQSRPRAKSQSQSQSPSPPPTLSPSPSQQPQPLSVMSVFHQLSTYTSGPMLPAAVVAIAAVLSMSLFSAQTAVAASVTTSSSASAAATVTATATGTAADLSTIRANLPLALALSSLAGASTGLGGLIAVLQRDLTVRRLGLWQGAAAGFMLSVSLFDLMPSVLADLDLFPAAVLFGVGAALFALLKLYIPEPDLDAFTATAAAAEKSVSIATNPNATTTSSSSSSSSNSSSTSSLSHLSPAAKAEVAGAREVLWSGLLTAAGISLHNFPEGVAVCVASLRGLKFGLPLAVAIGLHNIPEGMAVALPLYFATRNKRYAVQMAFLSGMAEPAGVIFVIGLIQLTGSLTKAAVAGGMSAVAGIMVVLSMIELVPQAIKHTGRQGALWSTVGGLACMTALMRALDSIGLGV